MKGDNIFKEIIDVFYGGISDDIRIQKPEVFDISQHFDIFTNPKRLTPFRAMEADENTAYRITAFAYDNSTLFGIGRKSAVTNIKIYQKTAGQALSSSWAASSNGESSNTNPTETLCAMPYHGYIYGGNQGYGVWAWGPTGGGSSFTEAAFSTGSTPTAQGIITNDDLLVIPALTELVVKNGAGSGPTDAWSVALSLPNNRQIRDLCEYGEFVAIACHPGGGYNTQVGSRVALWDKVSVDPSHWIEWGEGHLLILDNLEGTLIGISQVGFSDEGVIKQKLVVRAYTGGNEAQVIFELEADAGPGSNLSVQPNITKVKDGNRLSFALTMVRNGITYYQMASISRKSSSYPWAFSLDRMVDNTTSVARIYAAYKLGQTFFVAFNNSAASPAEGNINRSDDDANFTTATYITQRLNGESRSQDAARKTKQLLMAGLTTVPLTSGQAASLYYRVDGATSWTLIRTYTYGDDATNGIVPANMGFEAGSAGTSNTEFANYKEVQFKIESTGGAEITGLVWAWKFAGANIVSE